MEEYKLREVSMNGGIQKIYGFENGYGASVVRHDYSCGNERGLWELAVIMFVDDEKELFDLEYDTEITHDVIGHMSDGEVQDTLMRIKSL